MTTATDQKKHKKVFHHVIESNTLTERKKIHFEIETNYRDNY